MAFTKTQTGGTATWSTGLTVAASLTNNPTLGNLALVTGWFYDNTNVKPIVSCQDANGNVYTVDTHTNTPVAGSTGMSFCCYLLSAPSNAHKTVTVTFDKTPSNAAIWLNEFTPDAGKVAAFDTGQNATGPNDPTTGPTIVVNNPHELIIGVSITANLYTSLGGSWVNMDGSFLGGNGSEYQLDVSSNTVVVFTDSSVAWEAIGLAFKMVSIVAPRYKQRKFVPIQQRMVKC